MVVIGSDQDFKQLVKLNVNRYPVSSLLVPLSIREEKPFRVSKGTIIMIDTQPLRVEIQRRGLEKNSRSECVCESPILSHLRVQ